jgi:hypothetical protein
MLLLAALYRGIRTICATNPNSVIIVRFSLHIDSSSLLSSSCSAHVRLQPPFHGLRGLKCPLKYEKGTGFEVMWLTPHKYTKLILQLSSLKTGTLCNWSRNTKSHHHSVYKSPSLDTFWNISFPLTYIMLLVCLSIKGEISCPNFVS